MKLNRRQRHQEHRRYKDYLASDEWKELRAKAFQKHGKVCYGCGGEAKIIHHRNYKKTTMQGWRLDKLVPVCPSCHSKIHRGRPRMRVVNERLDNIRSGRRDTERWARPSRSEKRIQRWHDDSPQPLRSRGTVMDGVWRSE